MKALKNLRRFRHCLAVEAIPDPPHVALAEGRSPLGNQVDITSGLGVMAGMKPGRDSFNLHDIDSGGEDIVHPFHDAAGLHLLLCFKMSHLSQSVDTGVGPSRPLDIHGASGHGHCRLYEGFLDASGVLLGLPPAIPGSVVLQGDLVFMHALSLWVNSPAASIHRLPGKYQTFYFRFQGS